MSPIPTYDRTEALSRLGDDEELLDDLIGMFVAGADDYLGQLDDALARGDRELLTRTAHTLKGLFATFSAESATLAAKSLEQIGRAGNLEAAPAGVETLKTELRSLLAAFAQG